MRPIQNEARLDWSLLHITALPSTKSKHSIILILARKARLRCKIKLYMAKLQTILSDLASRATLLAH